MSATTNPPNDARSDITGTWYPPTGPTINKRFGRFLTVNIKVPVLIFLLAAHVCVTFFVTVPGYLSIDEAIYHWTVRDFASSGSFEIWNGYREYPSIELAHAFLRVHDGRPVSQYPYLFPLLSLPFYQFTGFFGLFLLNSLSFVGLVLLSMAVTQRLFEDHDLALNSALILVLGTFAWEYSQAAWPHSISLFASMAAFYLFVRAYCADDRSTAFLFALFAGLVAGFSPGIRLDAVLILPCLVLPFLFSRPWRPVEAVTILLGALPGLAVLTATNYVKFGVITPFSYGTSYTGYSQYVPAVPLVVVCLILAIIQLATRSTVRSYLLSRIGRKWPLIAVAVIAAAAGIAVLLSPELRAKSSQTARTAYAAVIDIRAVETGLRLPAMQRTHGGGVVYRGAHKKALLQSLPFMAILILPILSATRTKRDLDRLLIVFLVPMTTIGFYCFFPHGFGGLCLNYRFFLPALPFISVLTAYALRELTRERGAPFGFFTGALVAGITALLFVFLISNVFVDLPDKEFPLLVIPLFLAGFLLVTLVLDWLLSLRQTNVLRSAVWILVVISISWAGSTAFYYDYPNHYRIRRTNYLLGDEVLRLVPRDSIFFTAPYIDPFLKLIEGDRIRIAFPLQDGFEDFFPLVDFHLSAGRRVLAVFRRDLWMKLIREAQLTYRIELLKEPVIPGAFLGEITLPD